MNRQSQCVASLCVILLTSAGLVSADVAFPKSSDNPVLHGIAGRWVMDMARMRALGYEDMQGKDRRGFRIEVDNAVVKEWTQKRERDIANGIEDLLGPNHWVGAGTLTTGGKEGEFLITEHGGQTFVVLLFKGFEPFPCRVAFVHGRTPDRDMMFFDGSTDDDDRPVVALRRFRLKKDDDKKVVASR